MNETAHEIIDERPAVASAGPRRAGAAGVAATALAAGATVQEAARRAGIGRRTLTRWLSTPAFAARVEQLRTQAVSCAMNTLTDSMSAAARTLTELLDHGKGETRLRAARTILELGMRLKEHGELVERITELEQAQAKPARVAPFAGRSVADVL